MSDPSEGPRKGEQAGATAADAAMAAARAAGIDMCFANPGTTEMFLVAALDQNPGIRACLGLHEAVCTGACDGYARIARRPAMALLHLGAGLGNGLCNLHNAWRARSPVVVLLGEHATWHRAADPLLNTDIAALANTVGTLHTITSAAGAPATLRAAVAATAAGAASPPPGPGVEPRVTSSIATVVFPHDISWEPREASSIKEKQEQAAANGVSGATGGDEEAGGCSAAEEAFVQGCAQALKEAGACGRAALLLGGCATLQDDNAVRNAGLIAAATGAHAYVEPLFARVDRGSGLPHLRRLPYFPQEAASLLSRYKVLVLLDTRRPVAMFGYKGGPSQLVNLPDSAVWDFDDPRTLPRLLARLADATGAGRVSPGVNCGGVFATPMRPPLPPLTDRLTAAAVCQVVAALQPEGCVVVDESLTSGGAYWDAAKGCPPFSHLGLTGGAIGCGPPMALGAALAAPTRRIINLQADGSGMYTLQALWSQAREGAAVLTIVFANASYAILQVEGARQRIPPPPPPPSSAASPATSNPAAASQTRPPLHPAASAPPASVALTSLANPPLDWVALAAGMGVRGGAARSVGRLVDLVKEGLAIEGPFLIAAEI